MSSFEVDAGVDALQSWVEDQQRRIANEAEPLPDADAAAAIGAMLVGAFLVAGGWLLIRDAATVSGRLLISYAAAGRAAVVLSGFVAIRLGLPRTVAGYRTMRRIREAEEVPA
ncbi:hypothetical protein VB773_14240 [Haloarculaceae archaeon H-GB2-1]|nr:hypothetical protein [Haloarculaceae archaeon H-GB1-1]MEA5408615.1 hypothetical protein [Haloarculaceae archaeon H-GB2-1]